MLKEFREFIAKGNVMDLAVGVIIGAAFQRIVDSLVNDLVMPVVGFGLGGTDFNNLYIVLQRGAPTPYSSLAEARAEGAAVFAYGSFLTHLLQFVILAWIVFMMVKAVNRMRRTK